MKESLRVGVLLAVVALVYVNTLRNEFTMDDGIYILLNPQVTHASVRALFAPHEVSNVFRPVTFATFALNWRLGGARPFGFHLFNLILHGGASLLLYLLLEVLLGASPPAKAVAFAAALVFAATCVINAFSGQVTHSRVPPVINRHLRQLFQSHIFLDCF